MRYKHITAYHVHGMVMNGDCDNVTIIQEQGIHAFLTRSVNEPLVLIDRQTALGYLLLSAIFQGLPMDHDPKAARERKIAEIVEARVQKNKTDGYLIVEVDGDVDVTIPPHSESVEDFRVCMDAYDKKALSASVQPDVASALSAVRMAGATDYRFEQVTQGSYLIDDTGLIVHSISISGNAAELTVGRVLTAEQIAAMREFVVPLRLSPELAQTIDLHAQSLNRQETKLRAFMAAWNALELFVKATKNKYGTLWSDEKCHPATTIDRVAELDSIPQNNSELARKFGKMACYLGGDTQVLDIVEFIKLVRIRNGLSHELKDKDLPVHRVHQLFDKYMKAHLRHK